MSTLTTAELRRRNRNQIFRYIYAHTEQTTKQEIGQNLYLSLPTVTQNLKELMDAGCIEYVGTLDSTGGRKPKTIGVCADAKCAVGIMVSSQQIRMVSINLKAEITAWKWLNLTFTRDDAYCKALGQALETFLDENGIHRGKMLGVGIALPGIIDDTGTNITLAYTLMGGTMTREQLVKYIPYPCWIENDANAGGIAEWWNCPNPGNMVYLSVQRGVGGAVLLEGAHYMGHHSHSGEFGHMTLVPGGRECTCGKRGCLEAYCSTDRLGADHGISLTEFFAGLHEGRQEYAERWNQYLDYLAIGINNIRMALDCDVALGGLLAHYMEKYHHMPELQERLEKRNSFAPDGSYLRLCRYRSWSTCVGAALHFLADFIDNI